MFRVGFRNDVSNGTSGSKAAAQRSYTTLDLGDTITRQIDGSSFYSRDISREFLAHSFFTISHHHQSSPSTGLIVSDSSQSTG